MASMYLDTWVYAFNFYCENSFRAQFLGRTVSDLVLRLISLVQHGMNVKFRLSSVGER